MDQQAEQQPNHQHDQQPAQQAAHQAQQQQPPPRPQAQQNSDFMWYVLISPFILIITIINLFSIESMHIVPEGHVGLYTRGGRLVDTMSEPGINLMIPFITRVHFVQTTLQSDFVTNISCGTSSGVVVQFGKVQVINRLKKSLVLETVRNYSFEYDKIWIYDKIHHEFNQFCTRHTMMEVYLFEGFQTELVQALQQSCDQYAPGIEIIKVMMSKPTIPSKLTETFVRKEQERIRLSVTKVASKVEEKKSETSKLLSIIDAETQRNVSDIKLKEQILRQIGQQKINQIENQIFINHQNTLMKIQHYNITLQNEVNAKKLTPNYMVSQAIGKLYEAEKVFYGKSYEEYYTSNQDIL